ncbi:MAG: MCE family protein [Candidatus Omnitrophica bacterium]|nr:MCE family protein [Candidatus Omnitrophota bacterium]
MKISNEAQVGILITVVVILLAILTFKTGDFKFNKEGYGIYVTFKNVDGISENSPVMFNGYEIGHVKDVRIKDEDGDIVMLLDVWLNENIRIREGSKAFVKNLGFMGEKYISLTSGTKGLPYLNAGATIIGEEPVDFDQLLRQGEDIAGNLKNISENVHDRLEINQKHIDEIFSNMNKTIQNAQSISKQLDERLAANRQNIDDMLAHMRAMTVNMDQFSYDLKMNPWKLLYRTKEKQAESIRLLEQEQNQVSQKENE